MPTKRRRLTVTETPVVERRLDLVASSRPDLAGSRHDQLLYLTELGEKALLDEQQRPNRRAAARERLLARTRALTAGDAVAILAGREAAWDRGMDG